MTDKVTLSPEVWKRVFASPIFQRVLALLDQIFKRTTIIDNFDAIGISFKELEQLRGPLKKPICELPFCLLINSTKEGERRCRAEGKESSERAKTSRKPDVWLCHAGLTDITVPIIFQSKYNGDISVRGGLLLHEPNEQEWLKIAENVKDTGVDLDRLKQAYFEITPISKELLDVMLTLLSALVEEIINTAVEVEEHIKQIAYLENALNEKYRFANIIGKSKPMQEVFKLLETITQNNASVLIQGETGTGKELVAKATHYNSPRKDKPFITQNCATLSESLLESELFGHVKGAFTGAVNDKRGIFEMANKGTLFLDEIGEMSSGMQAKLLRVIEQGEFRRVGDEKVIKVDVRIISATNKDLKSLIQQGKFREDLYYRLQGFTIILPPLRERKEDIPILVEYFLNNLNKKIGKKLKISNDALRLLIDYDWPGNVRELETEIERVTSFSKSGELITPEILSNEVKKQAIDIKPSVFWKRFQGKSFPIIIIEELEKELILTTLEQTGWNKVTAAKLLHIPRSTLYNKIRDYGLKQTTK